MINRLINRHVHSQKNRKNKKKKKKNFQAWIEYVMCNKSESERERERETYKTRDNDDLSMNTRCERPFAYGDNLKIFKWIKSDKLIHSALFGFILCEV